MSNYWLFQVMYDALPESWHRMLELGVAAQHYPPGWTNEQSNITDLQQLQEGDWIIASFKGHRFAAYGRLRSGFRRETVPSFGVRNGKERLTFGERIRCDWHAIPPDQDRPWIDLGPPEFQVDLKRGRCVAPTDKRTFQEIKRRIDSRIRGWSSLAHQLQQVAVQEHDVVFFPNHAGYGNNATARVRDLDRHCRDGYADDWTTKKKAANGDIYLFYFGKPIQQIRALGICCGDVKELRNDDDDWDWTSSKRGWFCQYEPLIRLPVPITTADILANETLAGWWSTRPYRGLPKTVKKQPAVANELLSLVASHSAEARFLLSNYLQAPHKGESEGIAFSNGNDAASPAVARYEVSRRVRDTPCAWKLKRLYKCTCQVCGTSILLPDGKRYCEVHHLRPLGGGHDGCDGRKNMLVVCPNCHVEFDSLAIALKPKRLEVLCCDKGHPRLGQKVRFEEGHELDDENVEYHWRRFLRESHGRS